MSKSLIITAILVTSGICFAEKSGKELIAGSDCATCHQPKTRVIGPSYEEMRQRYGKKDVPTLADKVINGGSGNWEGIQVPMTPHKNLSKDEAKKMVEYMLGLEKPKKPKKKKKKKISL